MLDTKLEYKCLSQLSENKCSCGVPLELHIAQMVFLKCPKCGMTHSKGLTLQEAQKFQDDFICA